MTETARAVRFDRYGGRDELYVTEVPMPVPSPGQVVVAVRTAGINPGETSIREGRLHDRLPATFPSGEGSDLAGVVTAVGDGVGRWVRGDEVLGYSWDRSSHASHVAVPAGQLVPRPPTLPWEVAGSLYVAGCTAFAAVRAVGAGPGDSVAVSAAAGGVGSIVVQLLGVHGAQAVGIASSANADWLTAHGAIPVPYGDGLADRLRATAPDGIDAFIDLFGPEYVQLAVDLGVDPDRIDTTISFDKAAEVGARTEGSSTASTPDVLTELADLLASGAIEMPIAATFPLEQVADAFELLEHRHTRGKVVLVP
jgi:NADPH:quinone reductase-like Zn-dependent oxidoreductase